MQLLSLIKENQRNIKFNHRHRIHPHRNRNEWVLNIRMGVLYISVLIRTQWKQKNAVIVKAQYY